MEANPSAATAAPPVVAVVVCADPGAWFEECLASLAAQDYPNLSVLVIDTSRHSDATARVADVLPRAFVRRSQAPTFAAAANEVLEMVEGASLYLFCHDDVALAADALRAMVEEAFRSNAGIVGPKVVQWSDPSRLVSVGLSADRFGAIRPLVEPGELDQEQHDAVRDVFFVPTCASLVRCDLFAALGGFDPAIEVGEGLDLCWRAQIAGARVMVAPQSRVRHVQARTAGERLGWEGPAGPRRAAGLREANRLRSVLVCYGLLHLLWIAPAAGLSLAGEALVHLLRGRPARAHRALNALRRAPRQPRALWQSRRRVQRHRAVSDRELHRLQSRGNARLRALLRSGLGGDPVAAGLGSSEADALAVGSKDTVVEPAGGLRAAPDATPPHGGPVVPSERPAGTAAPAPLPAPSGRWQAPFAVACVLIVILLIGSRSLLGHGIPDSGQLPFAGGGVGSWWHQWWSAWRPQGLGGVGAGAPAMALLALGGSVFFGAVGTFQHVVVLGPLVIGPWGMWRATRRLGGTGARLVAVVVYAAVPVPYNALAEGRWGGVIMYGAAPWVIASLSKAAGEAPFPAVEKGARRAAFDALRLGLLTALIGAFVPVAILVVPVVALALGAGCALSGRAAAGLRGVVVGAGAAAVAIVALFPWSIATFGSVPSLFGVSGGPAARLGLGKVLRFDTGPVGTSWLSWAILAAAALALAIGGAWRLGWAARWWAVALVCWGLTWLGGRGWLPVPVANPEVLLAPAAAALAMCCALGATAFEQDLPAYRFGWRQMASALAAVAVVIGALPMLGAVGDGRWHIPSADATSVLPSTGASAAQYRVLWIGAPAAIPGASWRLVNGVGYATSLGTGPQLDDLWLPGAAGTSSLLAHDVVLSDRQDTTQLGHLLAPLAVRYIVVPDATAPSGDGGRPVPVPAAVLAGLKNQTDLEPLITDPNYTVYQNVAWAPGATVLSQKASTEAAAAGPAASSSRLRALQSLDMRATPAVLPGALAGKASGPAASGTPAASGPSRSLYVAVAHSSHLHLEVGGHQAAGAPAFGWATRFVLTSGGQAHFSVSAPALLRAGQAVEIFLVVAGIGLAIADSSRRRRLSAVAPGPSAPPPAPQRGAPGHRHPVPAPVGGFDEDLWSSE